MMNFLVDKIMVNLFILHLKTKKILRSAVSGKIRYHIISYMPFVVGALVAVWAVFTYIQK